VLVDDLQTLVVILVTDLVMLVHLPERTARSAAFSLVVLGDAGPVAGAGCLSTHPILALMRQHPRKGKVSGSGRLSLQITTTTVKALSCHAAEHCLDNDNVTETNDRNRL
jgi:hypothetical protein